MSDKKPVKFVKPNQDYMPEGDSAVLMQSIDELGLNENTLAKLKSVGMEKNIDLARCQMKHFYKIPNMNKKNIFEVLKKLQNVGLDFKRSPLAATVADSDNNSSNKPSTQTQSAEANKNEFAGKKENKSANFAKDKNKKQTESCSETKIEDNSSVSVKAQQHSKKKDKFNKKDKKSAENRDQKQIDNTNNQKDFQNKAEIAVPKVVEGKKQVPRPIVPQQVQANQQKTNITKSIQEPKRVKVNSYDIDDILIDNVATKKKTLKQEREEKIAKAIKNLPPLKNQDGLYKFFKHGKWGYKTESGKVVIEPTYSEAFNFKEGLACVELNERCGFINKQGEIVIPIQYDTACSFSEGLASVTKGDKCGYIDKQGNIVFDFVYEAATSFENDIALVKKEGKWGYMDRKTGEIRLR